MKTRLLILALLLILPAAPAAAQPAAPHSVYIPLVSGPTASTALDWPQLGHDPQRTGYTALQVSPPYCYVWKWNAVPLASRAQPVVANGILFIGTLDGRLYAREAATGRPLWNYATGGPIRHAPAAAASLVVTGSYDGYTYALAASTGALSWKTFTGSSATAPLIDPAARRVFVASTYGDLTALDLLSGAKLWSYAAGAALLTSPALSPDGATVYAGSEAMQALALDAASGALRWKSDLPGQSLAERYPVATPNAVFYRSQPYYYFHNLLQEWGDDVLDQAGPLDPSWTTDWAAVRPKISAFLAANPTKQTFFALNPASGTSLGLVPLLYTYGSNDIPNTPVAAPSGTFVTYRPRHGIQTDAHTVHVSTRYDAELGRLDLPTLDISGLAASSSTALAIPGTGGPAFRMTSDEAAMLSMGGDILWVDSWERLGGINVRTGEIVHAGNVANDWPECDVQCGPAGPRPFFPLSGRASDPAYPFPGPRVTEGHARGGAVIASNLVFWRAAEAGLAAFGHSSGASCALPSVWTDSGGPLDPTPSAPASPAPTAPLALQDYVTTDRTQPSAVTPQNQDLVDRLNREVAALLAAANNAHLLPYYLERGFTSPRVWPYNSTNSGLPEIVYISHGSAFWHDPGELLLSLAQAYPYLSASLKTQVFNYMQAEMARYSPLQDLPYNNPARDWLRSGSAREPYPLVVRPSLNNWPPVAANPSALYALWLWSKNTGSWTYAQANWSAAKSLFDAYFTTPNPQYYADIAGAIGYYRLALHFGDATQAARGLNAAVSALQAGLAFSTFRERARDQYPDPRGLATGWSAPVFFGLTPELGAFLRDQTSGQAAAELTALETLNPSGVGLLWWYFTRAGEHAEVGETSFLAPLTAWSHFLAHAYLLGDSQTTLRRWLDRPWVPGDLYSLQKLTAALQSAP